MGLIVMSSGLYCCMLSASLYSSSSVFCTLWFISGGGGLMGGEVTVYSGAPMLGAADAGMLGISWKLRPGMSNPGICIPLIGGMPPIILDISLDIIEEDELEKEDEDVLLEEEFMLIDPIFDIIFPVTPSSVTKAWLCAFIASDTCVPSGASITRGADTVKMPVPEYVLASFSVIT